MEILFLRKKLEIMTNKKKTRIFSSKKYLTAKEQQIAKNGRKIYMKIQNDLSKVKEIVNQTWGDYEETRKGQLNIKTYIEDACLDMAAWKQEQMIERAVGFLKLHMPFGEVSEALKNEVIEDFKKEMKKG